MYQVYQTLLFSKDQTNNTNPVVNSIAANAIANSINNHTTKAIDLNSTLSTDQITMLVDMYTADSKSIVYPCEFEYWSALFPIKGTINSTANDIAKQVLECIWFSQTNCIAA